jgi:alanine racemase
VPFSRSENHEAAAPTIDKTGIPAVLAVLKANAYGHGAVGCAKVCQEAGVDFIGVACAREGVAFREAGVTLPILIFGVALGSDIEAALKNGLIQTVGCLSCAKNISDTAVRLNLTADVHIQVDTGMAWIGFPDNAQGKAALQAVSKLPNIRISGIFSHLAASDRKDKVFATEQLDRFLRFSDELADAGLQIPFRHISNSGTVLDGAERFGLSMVRAGISLYGLSPTSTKQGADELAQMGFRPVLTLKSKISHVRWLEAGQSVGYSRNYFTDKRTKVAVVSAGYADGYSRQLSNRGRVLINGEYADVIGNVCMDHFMVDVTHIEDVCAGGDVVLMGEWGGKVITVEEVADICNTLNYEVVTSITERVPRVFV